jgi:hypothetical protein
MSFYEDSYRAVKQLNMDFESVALEYFRTQVPKGMVQRLDGVECYSTLSGYLFWHWRLNRMAKRGLLRKTKYPTIWRSLKGMPAYGLPVEENNSAF